MGFGFIDFTEDTPEGIEEQATKGQKQPGWYHVRIDDVDDTVQNGVKFVFEILDGPGSGKHQHTLFGFENAQSDENVQTIIKKIKAWAGRLKVAPFGESREPNWVDAIGWEGFLRLKQQRKKNEAGQWVETPYLEADYIGVYPLDYPPNKFPKDFQDGPRKVWGHLLTGKNEPTIAERAGRTSGGKATQANQAAQSNGGGETGAPASGGTGGNATATAAPAKRRATVDDL